MPSMTASRQEMDELTREVMGLSITVTTIRQEKVELNHPVSQEMPSMTPSRQEMDELTKEVMGLSHTVSQQMPSMTIIRQE
jgi:hypothetical protein